jgi:hypothetical protein
MQLPLLHSESAVVCVDVSVKFDVSRSGSGGKATTGPSSIAFWLHTGALLSNEVS